LSLGEGDLLFVPTVSSIELMGLARCLSSYPASAGASWHLLFRRNLYAGHVADYDQQESGVDELRLVFRNALARLANHRIFFYTDTEELSGQYERLGAARFHTLPIPHTRRPKEAKPESQPLCVLYAGDARGEKGYQHLPGIIQDLWRDYAATGKVEFALQSNYNIAHGDPEVAVARCQLEQFPDDKVKLYKKPLSSAEYQSLLLGGDINLPL